MKPIKVSIFGADGYTCQMPRIKEAMQSLGHILSEDSPDMIYSNDPTGYEKAMRLKKKFPEIKKPTKEDIGYATTNRQAAVKKIAKDCEMFFIIGSKNSSNSKRLVEVAKKSGGKNSELIDFKKKNSEVVFNN